ncbi:MAG: glycosyltransferase, partial [Bacteroidales bacterium]|nr:glycosyltransferase [Bacteroidales bacterium]
MMQFENPHSSIFLLIVFIIFIACTIKQLLFYWGIFSRLAFFRKKKKSARKQPVSIVLSAKNEYYNLEKNLPLILEQDYFDFEVVVVNDSSNDESIDLLNDMSTKYQNLKIVDIKQNLNFFSGKKFPLSLGIKSAKNELILLTD